VTDLRVATLNLWGRQGPWPDRLALVRAELRRLSPRLVGLQEVTHDGTCQAEEVAEGLGYQVVYAPASELDDGTFGNALLSDLPVLEHRVLALPTEPGLETRALLYALVATPDGGELAVFVTHLDWQPDRGAARLAQVRFVAARAAELAPDGRPQVLVGDFNAEPGTGEIRHLCGPVADGGLGFRDTWLHAGDGTAGETFSPLNAYARRIEVPARRIDYVLTRGEVTPVRTEVAFRTPRGDVWPSDHFGLVSDLAL
jgi:endonuclease/exonuclease/phosphatase family metal-dependent hydrolase